MQHTIADCKITLYSGEHITQENSETVTIPCYLENPESVDATVKTIVDLIKKAKEIECNIKFNVPKSIATRVKDVISDMKAPHSEKKSTTNSYKTTNTQLPITTSIETPSRITNCELIAYIPRQNAEEKEWSETFCVSVDLNNSQNISDFIDKVKGFIKHAENLNVKCRFRVPTVLIDEIKKKIRDKDLSFQY
jgi:hypothetical protein